MTIIITTQQSYTIDHTDHIMCVHTVIIMVLYISMQKLMDLLEVGILLTRDTMTPTISHHTA